ncbi:MAG: biotin--[acetyl-CoA-carboxylase] ligase [Deltaproteobacteria bacterium]|nr:biotin--[acetyl-CoA-carboxylase] ligase [Deltaproteobacteria bacterium]
MKGQILRILRSENGIVSGETLSNALGVSRVSIWKHIKKLNELGYEIPAVSTGYQLKRSPDPLFPWEFSGRASKIHYFKEVTSTMDIARDLARKGCPDFTVVIAGRQKKGRGRMKRVWLSSKGGLYFTLVLRPELPPVFSTRVTFLASLVLARTLRKMFDIDAKVKWPNDILVSDKKISGILSEMEAEGDRVTFINIGMGINVNNDPAPEEPAAVSLKKIMGKDISRREVLERFLDAFERRMESRTFDHVISEWKEYTLTLNRQVKIVTARETSEGIAVDVDENGALILQLADGSIKKVTHGDCFLQ